MHTYRNRKNGSTFSTPCVCEGEDWEEVKPVEEAKPVRAVKKKQAAEPEPSDGGGEES